MGEIRNTDSFPYHCIGLLEITLGGGGVGWGTGALFDAKYVVTAGHCIVPQDKDVIAAKFHPAYDSVDPPTRGGTQIDCGFVKTAFAHRKRGGEQDWDIGVYRLSNPISLKRYMDLTIVKYGNEPGTQMFATGYPKDHHYYMWEEQELVSGFNVAEHIFSYTHPTSGGSSGSPLYQYNGNKASIYGIHRGLAANHDDKTGVLITQETHRFVEAALQWRGTDHFIVTID
jgi:V8-like Glu-specific endopeptidase